MYRYRNAVKRFFNKIRNYRGVTTRYDKNPENYLAGSVLALARIWMRSNGSIA
jgi:transposase